MLGATSGAEGTVPLSHTRAAARSRVSKRGAISLGPCITTLEELRYPTGRVRHLRKSEISQRLRYFSTGISQLGVRYLRRVRYLSAV